jgi:O-antigen ligase
VEPIVSAEWWRPSPARDLAFVESAPYTRHAKGAIAFGALVAFTCILVLAPQERFPALAPLRLAFIAATIAIVAHLVDRLGGLTITPASEFRIAGVLLGWSVLLVPLSLWPGGSVNALTDVFLKSLLVFWLLGRAVNTEDRLHALAWTLALLSIPLAMAGVENYLAGTYMPDAQGRIVGYRAGIAGNPNDLALTLNIFLPMTFVLAVTARSLFTRLVLGLILIVNVVAVIVTFSRGGFLALALIAILSLAWLVRSRAYAVIGIAMLVGLLAIPLLPAGYVERLQTLSSVDADPTGSAQDRWRDALEAMQFIREHPLIGAGIGQDVLALNALRGATWKSVHNVYLQYGVDLGVPGMLLFVALLVTSIRTASRVERNARYRQPRLAALAAGVRIGLMAFGLAAVFYPVAYYFYFYYLSGLAVALRTIAGSRAA